MVATSEDDRTLAAHFVYRARAPGESPLEAEVSWRDWLVVVSVVVVVRVAVAGGATKVKALELLLVGQGGLVGD